MVCYKHAFIVSPLLLKFPDSQQQPQRKRKKENLFDENYNQGFNNIFKCEISFFCTASSFGHQCSSFCFIKTMLVLGKTLGMHCIICRRIGQNLKVYNHNFVLDGWLLAFSFSSRTGSCNLWVSILVYNHSYDLLGSLVLIFIGCTSSSSYHLHWC